MTTTTTTAACSSSCTVLYAHRFDETSGGRERERVGWRCRQGFLLDQGHDHALTRWTTTRTGTDTVAKMPAGGQEEDWSWRSTLH